MTNLSHQKSEFKSYMDDELNKLELQVLLNAEEDAKLNTPRVDETLHFYFNKTHQKVQGLINHSASFHGTEEINKQSGAQKLNEAKSKQKKLENQIRTSNEKLLLAEADLAGKHPPYDLNKVILVWVIISLIAIYEGLFSIGAWESIGQGFVESLLCGLLFSVVMGAFCHLVAMYIKQLSTKTKRRVFISTVFIISFILFWHLGALRASYLASELSNNFGADAGVTSISALPFALLSTLLLFVGIALSYFYLPSKKLRKQMEAYLLSKKERNIQLAEKTSLEEQLQKLQKGLSDELLDKLHQIEQGTMMEEYLVCEAHRLLSVYTSRNASFREDGIIPKSFSDPYPLTFKLYYTSKKTKS